MSIIDCKTVGELDQFLMDQSKDGRSVVMLDAYTNRRMWFDEDEGPEGEGRVLLYVDEDDPNESDMPVHRRTECHNGWGTAILVELQEENDNVYYVIIIGDNDEIKVSFAEVKWNLAL